MSSESSIWTFYLLWMLSRTHSVFTKGITSKFTHFKTTNFRKVVFIMWLLTFVWLMKLSYIIKGRKHFQHRLRRSIFKMVGLKNRLVMNWEDPSAKHLFIFIVNRIYFILMYFIISSINIEYSLRYFQGTIEIIHLNFEVIYVHIPLV